MEIWDDLADVPEHLRPLVDEPTASTVYLWADGGGTLYIESADYPLIVGGVEVVIGSSRFRQDAERWPCWLYNSTGVRYTSRDQWDDITDDAETNVVATFCRGLLQVCNPPLSGGNARDYIGGDYPDEDNNSAS